MPTPYSIDDTSEIFTPALVVFQQILEENLDQMVRIAGNAGRLRPHCKTHKMREIVQMQIARGIVKHKCATFAEAEMLADAGAKDIFLAYNLVGPNIHRAVRYLERFPEVQLAVTVDHPGPLAALGKSVSAAGKTIAVLLDLDPGLHRTGVSPGQGAKELYRSIAETPGVTAGGIHLYDGQNHQTPIEERTQAVQACWREAAALGDELAAAGWPVPRIVAGGTGSFPVYAQIDDPRCELSPGTCVFHDHGYGTIFPEMPFTPAAVVLTRVISRPTPHRITLDVGTKACASDPPFGQRLFFPGLPDAKQVIHNEEHLVLETASETTFSPGDEMFAIPRHVCPTTALHKQVFVIRDGRVADRWNVAARDRWLSV